MLMWWAPNVRLDVGREQDLRYEYDIDRKIQILASRLEIRILYLLNFYEKEIVAMTNLLNTSPTGDQYPKLYSKRSPSVFPHRRIFS